MSKFIYNDNAVNMVSTARKYASKNKPIELFNMCANMKTCVTAEGTGRIAYIFPDGSAVCKFKSGKNKNCIGIVDNGFDSTANEEIIYNDGE